MRRLLTVVSTLVLLAVLAACSSTPQNSTAWKSADIGVVAAKGSTQTHAVGNALTVTSTGYGLDESEDSFHFSYNEFEQDVDAIARLSIGDAPAGLMIRASHAADAAHFTVSLDPEGNAVFTMRAADGQRASSETHSGVAAEWVRLVHSGQTVTAYVSADGKDWTKVGTARSAFDASFYVGIAAAGKKGQPATTEVTEIEVVRPETNGSDAPTDETPSPAPGEPGDTDPAPTPEEPGTDTPLEPEQPDPVPPVDGNPGNWVCPSEPLSPAYSPTMFVSTTGSDSNDGRSESSPLRTLQAAADRAGAGDVVWVRGGVYSADVLFRRAGTSSRKIVFESYPGECAILDGSNDRQRTRFEGAHHNVFRNFVVRNSPQEGIFMGSSHNNTISNVISHNNAINGLLTMGGDNNLITKFIAYDNYSAGRAGDADGISISTGNNNRISSCVAFGNSDDGVDTWLSTNSVIEKCISFGNGYHDGRHVGDGNGFKAGGRGNTVNTIVRDSIAFGNYANGFDNNSGQNVTFENNTSFDNGRNAFRLSNGTARNNIAAGNGSRDLEGSGNTAHNNSWDLGINDPRFVSTNPDNPAFLSLDGSSPALGAASGSGGDLGALPAGHTIGSSIGVDLTAIRNYPGSR